MYILHIYIHVTGINSSGGVIPGFTNFSSTTIYAQTYSLGSIIITLDNGILLIADINDGSIILTAFDNDNDVMILIHLAERAVCGLIEFDDASSYA